MPLLLLPAVVGWWVWRTFETPVAWTFLLSFLIVDGFLVGLIELFEWLNEREKRIVATMEDPVFGFIEKEKNLENDWITEIDFPPMGSEITLFIDAPESGPTDGQRALYREIVAKYDSLRDEIRQALVAYVEEDWEFELGTLRIDAGDAPRNWSAQYTADTDEDGDMGYFVDIEDWKIARIVGVD